MESISVVTLTDRELGDHLASATAKILGFRHSGSRRSTSAKVSDPARGRHTFRPLQSLDVRSGATEELSFARTIQEILPDDDLYTDVEHHVLRVIRRGIQVYYHVYAAYGHASGLDRLKASNRDGELGPEREEELAHKVETAAAVSLFALGRFVSASLADYRRDQVGDLTIEIEPPESIVFRSRTDALHSYLAPLHDAIARHAKDDRSLIRTVLGHGRSLTDRIAGLSDSLRHTEFYTRYHYRIEPDGVTIDGFDVGPASIAVQVDVQRKRPEEVVGNHIAKFEAMRLAQRLACYDPEQQRNPFVDLGGFVFTFIGDGKPGTGKTTLIQMTVTLLRDYCAALSLPFRYANFSVDEISDYQGRSGQNAKRFCTTVMDPRHVGFGTIDDVDQVCGSRHDKNASAGQLEVTAVFMQEFAGPNTVVRGNCTFGLFSNYPEKVDDALRQRAQTRFVVDGPETREDFADLLHLFLGRDWELPLGADYEPYVTQQIRTAVRAKYAEHARPADPRLVEVFERTTGGRELTSWRQFGEYLYALHRHDERFTGRAVKNIADAVQARMMDFDLPGEWFDDRALFFDQTYERRRDMLRELRGEITSEIVLQEVNRYADSEARYADAARERELAERTRQLRLDVEARRALAEDATGGSE